MRRYDVALEMYNQAHGDPIVHDPGFSWVDILEKSCKGPGNNKLINPDEETGLATYDSEGLPLLEFMEKVGLVNRGYYNLKDTRISQWDTEGGLWNEWIPDTGSPRTYRIVQYDTSAGVQYSAESQFSIRSNPNIWFSLVMGDVPSDWDSEALKPFVMFELGSGAWAIKIEQSCGFLMKWSANREQYEAVMQLHKDSSDDGYQKADENRIVVRCQKGMIGIAFGSGRRFSWYSDPLGGALTIPQGKIRVVGQGGLIMFGYHQVELRQGDYLSPGRNAFGNRISAPTITGLYDEPNGSSVEFRNPEVIASSESRYIARLTPVSIGTGGSFPLFYGPSLYTVVVAFPALAATYGNTKSEPWSGRIIKASVNKAQNLADSTADVVIHWPELSADPGNLRLRKVRLLVTEIDEEDVETEALVFVGYITGWSITGDSFGSGVLTIQIGNMSTQLRRKKWGPLHGNFLGGALVNVAADYILSSIGWDNTYRTWDGRGDIWRLKIGKPEDPFEMLKRGESYWDTLKRIMSYPQLELAITDDGELKSIPIIYDTGVIHTYRAQGNVSVAAKNMMLKASRGVNYLESGTSVMVTGKGPDGGDLLAIITDDAAERSILSGKFSPWRDTEFDDLGSVDSAGELIGRAQAIAYEYFSIKDEPGVEFPLNTSVARRDILKVYGMSRWAIPDATEYVVWSIRHSLEINRESGGYSLNTSVGVRKRDEA